MRQQIDIFVTTVHKKFIAILLIVTLLVIITFVFFTGATPIYAATTPDLGEAASFSILSNTYTNTVGGTTINGDLGYTTGPATSPTVNGTTYSPPSSKYTTAGTDQGSALSQLASQPCTHTFDPGPVDLATDTSHGPIGVYTPGVYCTTAASAASIGAGGITLFGGGTYIFRIDGALTTVANSVVTLDGDASSCDVFWTPSAATTLGANSTFVGTNIDDSGITIGSTVLWTGRALAFAETVTTDTDTITAPTCADVTTPTPTSTSSSSSSSSASSSSSSSNSSSSNSDSSSPVICPTPNNIAPIIIESRRVDANSIFVSWGPYSGIDTFIVRYGLENGNWLYSTNVTGFSTTINALPSNQSIWIQVAATNSCAVGTFGVSTLIGGSSATNSLGFPNTGNPRLPNTGINPQKNNNELVVTIVSLAAFIFIRKVTLDKNSKRYYK